MTQGPPGWRLVHERSHDILGGVGRATGVYSDARICCRHLLELFELSERKGVGLTNEQKKEKIARFLHLMQTLEPDDLNRKMSAENRRLLQRLEGVPAKGAQK